MKRIWLLASVVAAASPYSLAARAEEHPNRHAYDKLIAAHAKANLVPEALVHRVIVRESKYNPDLVGHGGTVGLMQLKLATARGVGYRGDVGGLRDPETNLTYGIKYLAGAWRAAEGDHDRAMRYFAIGYYYVAKQQRLERLKQAAAAPPGTPPKPFAAAATSDETTQENARDVAAADATLAAAAIKPKTASQKTASHKIAARKPREAKAEVPLPLAVPSSGANDAKPR